MKGIFLSFDPIKEPFHSLNVYPCRKNSNGDVERHDFDELAQFFGVYAEGNLSTWIADFGTRAEAEGYADFLHSIVEQGNSLPPEETKSVYDVVSGHTDRVIEILFHDCHQSLNTKSGDIEPLQQSKLDALVKQLKSLIVEQVTQNL